jgi:hypothetical protein
VVVNVYQYGTGVVQIMAYEEKRGAKILIICGLLIIFALVVL